MRLRSRGLAPLNLSSVAARICVIGVAGIVAGCASDKHPQYVRGPAPHMVVEPAPVHAAKVQMEDDGKPAQEPGRRIRPEEDDPTQPWSSNYGKGVTPKPIKTPPRLIEAEAPLGVPLKREQNPIRLSDVDADQIMARAIAAHEMRRQ